jgi:hypothetical protein
MVCKYNKLTFHFPLLSLAKHFFSFFHQKLLQGGRLNVELLSSLIQMNSDVEHQLAECRELGSYYDESLNVIGLKYDYDYRFRGILSEMKILSNVYLSNYHFFKDQEASHQNMMVDGLVFNLNRPFEMILCRAFEEYFEGDAKFKHKNINDFTSMNSDPLSFQLKPDCWFTIENKEIILDAKHKVFSKRTKDMDDEIGHKFSKVGRSDMYQIISYAATRPDEKEKKGIYGLIALSEESSNSMGGSGYISGDCVWSSSSDNEFNINVLAMDLGAFLYDLGVSIEDSTTSRLPGDTLEMDGRGLFIKLGREMNAILKISNREIFQSANELLGIIQKDHSEWIRGFKVRSVSSGKLDSLIEIYKHIAKTHGCILSFSFKHFLDDEILDFISAIKSELDLYGHDDEEFKYFKSYQLLEKIEKRQSLTLVG